MRRLMAGCILLSGAALAQADEQIVADFEGDNYGSWTSEGDAFGAGPAEGTLSHQMPVSRFLGAGLANSYHGGDRATGTLTSPEFRLTRDYLSFLIGGGRLPDEVGIELLIDGERKRLSTGTDSEALVWDSWDVREFRHRPARVRIFDRATGGWGHILFDQLTLTDESRRHTEVGRLSDYRQSPEYFRERYRPQFHFTPEINWTNDPNGLVYFDGEYHLFYQHNPHGNEWGHMSWGHAVSPDLVHWEHLPMAFQDEYGLMAFSGSAVVDAANTSGFGRGDLPPLVAIYTGHGHGRQTQDLAYSNDRGRTWTKFAGNPVLDIGQQDFRDPKVFWHEPTGRWVMIVSLATQKKVQLYGSSDLKAWTLLSEFGPAGVEKKPNWECPDLFELPIENEPGQTRWVLEADMGSGAIAGGSGGEYFTGDFDGTRFVADALDSQWVDYGRDFYAPVSWSDIPAEDGRRIWLGWMNNWQTSLNPTYPWRGAMSIPRELTLRRIDGVLRLCQRPVRELAALRGAAESVTNVTLDDIAKSLKTRGQQLAFLITFEPGTATAFGLRVLQGGAQQTEIGYDVQSGSLYIDRTQSGDVSFHPAFAGRYAGPLAPDADGHVRLHVLVDACSVEVFGGYGETVITSLVFPDSGADGIELFATSGTCRVVKGTVFALNSVWHRPAQADEQH